jgi:hypothetical protein
MRSDSVEDQEETPWDEDPNLSKYQRKEMERSQEEQDVCEAYLDLFEDETILRADARPSCLILSSHRVRMVDSGVGSFKIVSIMLEEVASCSTIYTSQPLLLLLAMILALAGLYGLTPRHHAVAFVGFALMAMVLFAYWLSRKRVLAIASAGEAIRLSLSGWSNEDVLAFVEELEDAKNDLRHTKG